MYFDAFYIQLNSFVCVHAIFISVYGFSHNMYAAVKFLCINTHFCEEKLFLFFSLTRSIALILIVEVNCACFLLPFIASTTKLLFLSLLALVSYFLPSQFNGDFSHLLLKLASTILKHANVTTMNVE